MKSRSSAGWVLYDDSCGFCRRWVPFWRGTLAKRGLSIASLQEEWVRQALQLPPDELIQDLRLLLEDGRRLCGADVYRHAMKRIWWARPVYVLSIAPILRNIFDWSYRTFAANRYRISHRCGIPGAQIPGESPRQQR